MEKVYKIDENSIRAYAPDAKGVYSLGWMQNKKFVAGYVGRSDKSIRNRLLNHNHKKVFDYFMFEVVGTKQKGFLRETEEYYMNRNKTINKVHPAVPKGMITEHRYDILGRVLKKRHGGN
jgi:hypothetical protein